MRRRWQRRHGDHADGRATVDSRHRIDQRRHWHDAVGQDGRGLARIRGGQQEPCQPIAPRRGRHRQHAARGLNGAVERQLADDQHARHGVGCHHALRGKNTDRNGQVERRTGLPYIGRGQVHGDSVRREFEAAVTDGAAHAVAAFAHARIWQADHCEHGHAERHVHFHLDRAGLHAVEGRCSERCEHAAEQCKNRR